jgi:hypothetical protein
MKQFKFNRKLIAALTMGIALTMSCQTEEEPAPGTDLTSFASVIESGGVPAQPEAPYKGEVVSAVQDSTITDDFGLPEIWSCTTKEVELSENNAEFPLFTAGSEVIYPGNLLQGNSLTQATPSIIPLTRGGGTITINVLNGSNPEGVSETVEEVSFESIAVATNKIIGANNGNLTANTTIEITEINSTEEIGIAMNASYENLAVSIKGSFDYKSSVEYSKYMVKLTQSFYTLVYSVPTIDKIDQIFAPQVTPEQLSKYIYEGNPGTYISSVNYGRVFYLLIQSTDSKEEVKAAIDLSFEAVVSKGDASIDVEYVNNLSNRSVKGYAYGGDANLASGALMGDLNKVAEFIQEGGTINNGAPLSYVVRSLKDPSQVVSTSLATKYSITNCEPLGTGNLNFLSRQDLATTIKLPYLVVSGDINGDELTDLILTHTEGNDNETQIAFAQGDGTYMLSNVFSHPGTPTENWTSFDLKIGDLNGDDKDDIVWNSVASKASGSLNYVFTGISNGDGTFELTEEVKMPLSGWQNYTFHIADFNGDGRDDLSWNYLYSTGNRTHISLTLENGVPNTTLSTTTFSTNGWDPYRAFIGNFNGDNYDDYIFRRYSSGSALHMARSDQSGKLTTQGYEIGGGWTSYKWTLIGDVTKDGLDDVVICSKTSGTIHVFPGDGASGIINSRITSKISTKTDDSGTNFYLVDFNEDGVYDLLWNDLASGENGNQMQISIADGTGKFVGGGGVIAHPSTGEDWLQFGNAMYPSDLNSDQKTDLVWVSTTSTLKIYVALAL